ncbi:MAG: 2-amino-4-hydroxy-6-hydroxymethyldihydropteridine diphosphokinase [Methylococcales bacterium]|nr:2-amino-4-hydroxy-6-hydroxymethyldihydropteridine diphosphokinase [Methylococcales bacterium]
MSLLTAGIQAFIGLGSNLDNPVRQILVARTDIAGLDGNEEIAFSPLYTSRPVGPQQQPDYINAVMAIRTRLPAQDLLQRLQQIENAHGRIRTVRWGARTLDLDLLLYGQDIIHDPNLTVPHPEMARRAFVLYPLADIAGADLYIAGCGRLGELLAACPPEGLQRLPA